MIIFTEDILYGKLCAACREKIWYNYFSQSKHDFVDNFVKKEFNALTPSVHGKVLHTSKNLAGITGLNEILISLENKSSAH